MNQQNITDAEQAYRNLGVTPIINASGSVTRLGGSRTRPEVLEQMAGTARVMVNIDELNRKGRRGDRPPRRIRGRHGQ